MINRELLRNIFIFGVLHQCMSQMCTNIQSYQRNIVIGKRSSQTSLWIRYGIGFLQCVHTCQLNSVCQSINFQNSNGTCELMSVRVTELTLEAADGYVATNIREWPKQRIGNCDNHTCSVQTLCESRPQGHRCTTIGCFNTDAPYTDKLKFTLRIYNFGEKVDKPCMNEYYTKDAVTCLENGHWSEFACQPYEKIRNCETLKKCNHSYSDGEYWLYPSVLKGSMAKIYCADMETKPNEYITLVKNNYASRSIYVHDENCSPILASKTMINKKELGYTNFQKIAFDRKKGRIITDDFTFTWTNYTQIEYGISADCVRLNSKCSVLGRFQIDLRGTGFVIDKDVIWIQDNSDASMDIYVKYQNRVVTGVCGKGCYGCKPKESITLAEDELFHPKDESAVRPICT